MSLEDECTTTADRDARRRGPTFVPTVPKRARGANFRPHPNALVGATLCVTPRQTCPRPKRFRAQLAFKDSMVHGILQFTPSIAFRYVLHRCKSRDIRCRESFEYSDPRRRRVDPLFPVSIPWRQLRRIFCVVLGRRSGATVRLSGSLFPGMSWCFHLFAGRSAEQASTMILPQVHLRKPCYDFSFL